MTKCRSLHFCLLDRPVLKWTDKKGHDSPILLFPSKDHLLAVIYDEKFLTLIRRSL